MKRNYKTPLILWIISTVIFLIFPLGSSTPKPENTPVIVTLYHTDSGSVTAIPLETYVAGVISNEMSSSFHLEALKAQAVASRTYAVSKIRNHKRSDVHPMAPLCDSTHCQVYSSSCKPSVKIKKAVQETASEMIYYNGKLIDNALFHASSGGFTENSEDVFVSAVPYLKKVSSPYEKKYPRNGHGVGMSQQGANGMAKAGFDYKKILSHYYSGTVVY